MAQVIHERRRQGMTLLEVMIAMVVISTMAFLLISSTSLVRDYVRSVNNQQNLMQLSMTMTQYTETYGRYPPLGLTVDGFDVQVQARPTEATGFDYFAESLFLSPNDRNAVDDHGQPLAGKVPVQRRDGTLDTISVSYGYNVELIRTGIRHRRLANASQVAVFYDGSMSGPAHGGAIQGNYSRDGQFDGARWLQHSAATEGVDTLFADGHCVAMDQITPMVLAVWPIN